MLFRQRFLDGIRRGTVTLAFRRWRRPSVRSGGTLLTPIGQLEIVRVRPTTLARISTADARRAGYASRAELIAELEARPEGQVYRVELGTVRPDPRIALRAAPVTDAGELARLQDRLDRLDTRAGDGPWTRRVLALIATHEGVRAADLCRRVAQERLDFKANVRKLKALGLTESLEVGYRVSPRGAAFLQAEAGGARSRRPRARFA